MSVSSVPYPDHPFASPPALPDHIPLDVLEASDPGRSGDVVPSKGLEWSFVVMAAGIIGLLFLFFKVMGTPSDVTPTYDRESQIAPQAMRSRSVPDQPDLGAPANDNP